MRAKRRRGMTSILESVLCLLLLAFILSALMALISTSSGWSVRTNEAFIAKNSSDYLVEKIQEDIKSSTYLSATDESQLEIQNDDGEILYTFVGSKLFRNNDLAMENLKTCQFSQVDGNSIGIYIRTAEDNIIDLRISR